MNDLFWLTIILFIVAAALRSELFFYLLYVLVGLQVLARLLVSRSAQRLTWQRSAPSALFQGETAEVRLEVSNGTLLPLPWLSIDERVPPTLRAGASVREVVSLGAGERRVLRYNLHAARRGYYQLGPLSLNTGDVLGLRERSMQSEESAGLTVYPTVLPLAALGLPAALPFGTLPTSASLFNDPARPAGVRPYQRGDDPRRIDWKSSARVLAAPPGAGGQPLLVRRSDPAIALETVVALAFGTDEYGRFAYDDMERAVTAAASIAAHLSALRQPVGFATTGRDPRSGASPVTLPVATGREHLLEILGALGRIEPAAEGNIAALLNGMGALGGWGSTVVVVAGGDAALIEHLLPLRRRGLNVALVLANDEPATLGLARRHGMAAYGLGRDGRPV
jgi:uncharacterized protein (DUF58 family)